LAWQRQLSCRKATGLVQDLRLKLVYDAVTFFLVDFEAEVFFGDEFSQFLAVAFILHNQTESSVVVLLYRDERGLSQVFLNQFFEQIDCFFTLQKAVPSISLASAKLYNLRRKNVPPLEYEPNSEWHFKHMTNCRLQLSS
jgi:hypothetical protein